MGNQVPFKERVRLAAIEEASVYHEIFVKKSYLLYSSGFKYKKFYIIEAEIDNYLHLIGVNTSLSATEFFQKCSLGKLQLSDFDFNKKDSVKIVKGSVRRKINMLPKMMKIFDNEVYIEEQFVKNNIHCAIATSDEILTVGFTYGEKQRPKSLLKGYVLGKDAMKLDYIFSKNREDKIFNSIVYGNINYLDLLDDDIQNYVHI